ncbi:hypothetical protein TEK04_19545 [Klenkia sp. LSe6-5]|uniref:Uncharacterized protein n=1 Tax=Klenkia sesuvii TaxID=3103137 RepID=A0ABU8DYJ8_9ACTN
MAKATGTTSTPRSRAAGAETATNTRAETAEATPATGPDTASTATTDPDEERAQATGTTSESGSVEQPGAVVDTAGVEHVGVVPVTSELVNPLPEGGDHDRVAMLSVRADGTADQYDPEIVVDVAVARAATREQFTQQAVSAADVRLAEQAAVTAGPQVTIIGSPEGEPDRVVPLTTDATSAGTELDELRAEVVDTAVAAADAAVDRLTSGR